MNLISKAVVNLWSIYKPMNFRGRYLITYASSPYKYVLISYYATPPRPSYAPVSQTIVIYLYYVGDYSIVVRRLITSYDYLEYKNILFTVVKLMFIQYYPTIHVSASLLTPLLIHITHYITHYSKTYCRVH